MNKQKKEKERKIEKCGTLKTDHTVEAIHIER
jgi:hypothetical protein